MNTRLALVTINFGGVLCRNARQSFRAAADRWGAEYVELIPGRNAPMMQPALCKLRMFDFIRAGRVFYIDGADAIIRSDAPSPFEVCPAGKLGVVRNAREMHPDFQDVVRQERKEWAAVNRALSQSVAMAPLRFNAGVMVLTRDAHARLLRRAYEICRQAGAGSNWVEQLPINYAAAEIGVPMLFLDPTWNFMHPELAGHWVCMEHYVYHFAGLSQRHTVLKTLNWQAPPAGSAASAPSGKRRILRALCRVPVLGAIMRYGYWWATLPCKVNRMSDHIRDLTAMARGTHFLLDELRPGIGAGVERNANGRSIGADPSAAETPKIEPGPKHPSAVEGTDADRNRNHSHP